MLSGVPPSLSGPGPVSRVVELANRAIGALQARPTERQNRCQIVGTVVPWPRCRPVAIARLLRLRSRPLRRCPVGACILVRIVAGHGGRWRLCGRRRRLPHRSLRRPADGSSSSSSRIDRRLAGRCLSAGENTPVSTVDQLAAVLQQLVQQRRLDALNGGVRLLIG